MPVSRRIREKARTSLKKEKNYEKNKKIIGSYVYRRHADDVELLRRNVTAFGRLPAAASAARTGLVPPPAETGAAPSDATAPASSGTALVTAKNTAPAWLCLPRR